MTTPRTRFLAPLLPFTMALVALGACSSSSSDDSSFEAASDRWHAQNIRSYSFTLQRDCVCLEDLHRPVEITVNADQITRAVFADDQSEVPTYVRDSLLTIDGVFEEIAAAYDEQAAKIEAEYDASRGFPTTVFVDYRAGLADEELSLELSDFRTP